MGKIFNKVLYILTLGYYNGVEYIPIEDDTLTGGMTNNDVVYDELFKHQEKYTKLLDSYVHNNVVNLHVKMIFKIIFFCFTIWIWYMMTDLFRLSYDIIFKTVENTQTSRDHVQIAIDLLIAVIPSLVSLITSFIIIPRVIAKYLFNRGEEQSMVDIIKNLQTYDNEIFKLKREEDTKNNSEANAS